MGKIRCTGDKEKEEREGEAEEEVEWRKEMMEEEEKWGNAKVMVERWINEKSKLMQEQTEQIMIYRFY